MMHCLLFTLYAPLSSWGEIAVGENRGSWDRPSRSAILGLIGAALGITRDNQAAHDALDRDYGVAVRLDVPGISAIEYQTVQTAAESEIRKRFGKNRPETRRELLSVDERLTMVTRRELRQDALTTCALWTVKDPPRWSLDALRDALQRPTFVLYAGRKANAFGLPAAPAITIVPTLAGAFAGRSVDGLNVLLELLKPAGSGWGREVAHDPLPLGVNSGLIPIRLETRRDAHAHRNRWQFSERTVHVGVLPQSVSA